jgi:hypothetical protein
VILIYIDKPIHLWLLQQPLITSKVASIQIKGPVRQAVFLAYKPTVADLLWEKNTVPRLISRADNLSRTGGRCRGRYNYVTSWSEQVGYLIAFFRCNARICLLVILVSQKKIPRVQTLNLYSNSILPSTSTACLLSAQCSRDYGV